MSDFLTSTDYQNWISALNSIPQNPQFIMDWIEGPLRKFFPFTSIYCAYAEIILDQINILESISSGHSNFYLEQIDSVFDTSRRGALVHWLKTRRAFFIEPSMPNGYASHFELEEIRKFDLKNVVAHGIISINSNNGTYFSFSGIEGKVSAYHAECMNLICPVLHDLFIRYISLSRLPMGEFNSLTAKQKIIARLVAEGLDDKSIAKKLEISEKTVRNQLSVIYTKIGVHKRAQLIRMIR